MPTLAAEVVTPPPLVEAAHVVKLAEVVNAVSEPVTPLVHAPALVCYGGGQLGFATACTSAGANSLAGGGSFQLGSATASASTTTAEGVGSVMFDGAGAGPVETVAEGAGELALGASAATSAVEFSGVGAVAFAGARISAGSVSAAGEGGLDPASPVVIPKAAPGRVTFTARPTASVVAWAVPR